MFVCAEKPFEQRRFGNRVEKPVRLVIGENLFSYLLVIHYMIFRSDVLDIGAFANKSDRLWLDSRVLPNGYREAKQGYRINFELWCMRPALVIFCNSEMI